MTFDVGTTITVLPKLSVAVVGNNLRDLHNSNATQGVGYGIAVIPIQDLVIAADGFTSFTPDNQTGRKGTSVDGGRGPDIGREGRRAARGWLRRRDPATASRPPAFRRCRRWAPSTPASARTSSFTRAAGAATVVAISLRLFIPSQQPSLTPPGTL